MELGNPWPVAQRLQGIIVPITAGGLPASADCHPVPLRGPWETWRGMPPGTWQQVPRTVWLPAIIGWRPPADGNPLPVLKTLPLTAWSRWVIVTPIEGEWVSSPPWWDDWLQWGTKITTENTVRLHWVSQQPRVFAARGESFHWRRGW